MPAKYDLANEAKYITYGASPRATIGMIEGARALAMLRGRRYALPEDVTDMVADVMRHRVVLSYEALAEGLSADALVQLSRDAFVDAMRITYPIAAAIIVFAAIIAWRFLPAHGHDEFPSHDDEDEAREISEYEILGA
jgi:hypothetical protein